MAICVLPLLLLGLGSHAIEIPRSPAPCQVHGDCQSDDSTILLQTPSSGALNQQGFADRQKRHEDVSSLTDVPLESWIPQSNALYVWAYQAHSSPNTAQPKGVIIDYCNSSQRAELAALDTKIDRIFLGIWTKPEDCHSCAYQTVNADCMMNMTQELKGVGKSVYALVSAFDPQESMDFVVGLSAFDGVALNIETHDSAIFNSHEPGGLMYGFTETKRACDNAHLKLHMSLGHWWYDRADFQESTKEMILGSDSVDFQAYNVKHKYVGGALAKEIGYLVSLPPASRPEAFVGVESFCTGAAAETWCDLGEAEMFGLFQPTKRACSRACSLWCTPPCKVHGQECEDEFRDEWCYNEVGPMGSDKIFHGFSIHFWKRSFGLGTPEWPKHSRVE